MKPAALKSTSTANTARRFFLAARALAALAMAAVIVPGAIPAPALAATPQVTNVLAIQRPGTKLVDVTYDVYDADGHAMTVALYISPDGGVSFPIQGVTVTGDVGAGILSGTGRHIEWDAGADYPGHVGETYAPKVTADDGQGFDGMVWVPAGNVRLGQVGIAEPVNDFYVQGFYIDRYEVSNAKYKAFIDAGGYTTEAYWNNPVGWNWRLANSITLPEHWSEPTFNGGGIARNEQFPANGVSWFEADAYCRWAGGRLPTEAEWEKAAKGGCETHGDPGQCDASDTPSYPWGEDISDQQANYLDSGDPYSSSGYTTPVGYYDGSDHGGFQTLDSPSPYDLYDVAGNVWEWCSTKWDSYYPYPYDPNDGRESPPMSPDECCRVVRGGALDYYADILRCAGRDITTGPSTRSNDIGFRCARTGSVPVGWGMGLLFHLDTTLADQVWGIVRSQQTGTPIGQVLVEVLHGGELDRSVSTTSEGRYGFTGLQLGGYVLRVSKTAYSTQTTNLVQITSGTTNLQVDIALPPLNPGGLPDLSVQATDLTYTVLQNGRVTVTAMVHNVGQPAVNVPVRLLVGNRGAGANQTQPMGPDQILTSVPAGACLPVTLAWTPIDGLDRFYCVIDPANAVTENDELNNSAWRDLGEIGGSRPTVGSVTASKDGDPAADRIGRFLSGVTGCVNTFTAQVTDADSDVSSVEFKIGGNVLTDSNPAGGWSVSYDVGQLGPNDVTMTVTAVDATGLRSEPRVITIDMEPLPAWMGEFDLHPDEWSVAGLMLGERDNYAGRIMLSRARGGAAIGWEDYISDDVFLIKGKGLDASGSLFLDLKVPLDRSLPWNVAGVLDLSARLFGIKTPSKLVGELAPGGGARVSVSISPDGQTISGAAIAVYGELAVGTPTIKAGLPVLPGLDLIVGIGFDLLMGGDIQASAEANFTQYHWTHTARLGAQFRVTAGVEVLKFARAEFIGMPALWWNVGYGLNYPGSPEFVHYWAYRFKWKLMASVGIWGLWAQREVASGSYGPWCLPPDNPDCPYGFKAAGDTLTLPSVFPRPSLNRGTGNSLNLVWIRDAGVPGAVNPEVFYAQKDSSGTWGSPERITDNSLTELDPMVVALPDGRVLAVWTQGTLTPDKARAGTTLSTFLDSQDLGYAVRSGGIWSTPASVFADTLQHADGMPDLAVASSGQGMLVWARSMADSAMAPGSSEVFAAQWTGAGFLVPMRITEDGSDDLSPVSAMDGEGIWHALWLKARPDTAANVCDLWTARYDGTGWSAPQQLTDSDRERQDPRVVGLNDGRLLTAWIEVEQTSDTTRVSRIMQSMWSGGSWTPPVVAQSTPYFLDELTLDRDARNIAVLTWKGYGGYDGDLFASMKDMSDPQSSWTAPDTLSSDDETDWNLTAAVDDQNNLHFVDLKTNLADSTGTANKGQFLDGMAVGSRGIGRDLKLNDELNFGFRPLAADLKSAGTMIAGTPWPALGDPDSLLLRVTNIGAVLSGVNQVRFTDGHPDSGGVTFATLPLLGIYPGDTTTVRTAWNPAAGTHQLWAWLDPLNTVPEQTESNNRTYLLLSTTPDILADSVWFSPDNVNPGDVVSVSARVRNIGGLAAASVRVQLQSGASTLADTVLLALARGDARTVTRSWIAAAGSVPFDLVVDPDSTLAESNDGNNTLTSFLAVLPDLEVLSDSLGLTVLPDSTYRWSARIYNRGGIGADSVSVQFYAGHPLNEGVFLGEAVVQHLAARDSAQVTVESGHRPGTTRLHVFADHPEKIAERSEENNHAEREFLLTLLPDLAVGSEDIEFSGCSGPGIPFGVVVTVHNLGSAEVVAPSVRFYEGHPDSGGVYLAGRLIPNIPPGQTGTAGCEWMLPDSLPRTFFVQVDRENAIEEAREDNNLAVRPSPLDPAGVPDERLPGPTELFAPRPNPFGTSVRLAMTLAKSGDVRLEIFDVIGRRIRDLSPGVLGAGQHTVGWDGRDSMGQAVPAGVYFIRMRAAGQEFHRRGILIR